MPKTDDERRREEALAREAALSEEQRAQMAAAAEVFSPRKPSKEKETKFAPLPGRYNEGWKKVVAAYKEQGSEPDENGVLVFPSLEAAIKFFTELAATKLSFFATKYEEDKPTDFHVFSCGDGQLYKGSYVEIKDQLETAAKSNPLAAKGLAEFKSMMPNSPSPTPNPASDLRGQLQKERETAKGQAADAERPAIEASTAPTPTPR